MAVAISGTSKQEGIEQPTILGIPAGTRANTTFLPCSTTAQYILRNMDICASLLNSKISKIFRKSNEAAGQMTQLQMPLFHKIGPWQGLGCLHPLRSCLIMLEHQTNNRAELCAVLNATERAKGKTTIVMDSDHVYKGFISSNALEWVKITCGMGTVADTTTRAVHKTAPTLFLRTALKDSPRRPPTTNCSPPPATNHQPPIASCRQPPTANRRPPTANRQLLKERRSHDREADGVLVSGRSRWRYEGFFLFPPLRTAASTTGTLWWDGDR